MTLSTANQPFLKLFREVLKKRPHLQETYNHVEDFIDIQFGASDVFLSDITKSFLDNFRAYLESFSIQQIEEHLKRITSVHAHESSLHQVPLPKLTMTPSTVPPAVLSESDLRKILAKDVSERLKAARKLFLVQCLSGKEAATLLKMASRREVNFAIIDKKTTQAEPLYFQLHTMVTEYFEQNLETLAEVHYKDYKEALLALQRLCGIETSLDRWSAKSVYNRLLAGKLTQLLPLMHQEFSCKPEPSHEQTTLPWGDSSSDGSRH